MLNLTEWLKLVGLEGGNPFAYKQADVEREWLQACFVEHPAYNALALEHQPRSSILHAARGAGKTSACMMYEQLCLEELPTRRDLVVHFDDWITLLDYQEQSLEQQVAGYLENLFRHVANQLGLIVWQAEWLRPASDPSLQAFLAWFCRTYGDELTDGQLADLLASGRLFSSELAAHDPPVVRQRSPHNQLTWLLRALHATGWRTLIVLVDRVDEVALSVDDAAQGANLLLPFVGNLPLMEQQGLVFKFFVPSEVVKVLRERKQLRDDRLRCDHLDWAQPQMLRQILQNRLRHFSGGRIDSLAALAAPELRDIDDQLVLTAQSSPRRLLLLGETLLQTRAADASSGDLLIRPIHLEQTLLHQLTIPQLSPTLPLVSVAPSLTPSDPVACNIPRLQMRPDGRVLRGNQEIPDSTKLSRLQRGCLRYLLSKAGTICHYNELGREIWYDETMGEENIRKVLSRLMDFINDGDTKINYIERQSGGAYILQHADLLPLDQEPLLKSILGHKAPRGE
ncbi:hypothetical protein [Candidatus Viridilinea mediisalina]|uniref:Uncharacterized protein n=1 Tax=Candidatus Viridilinea mediisalina TaxID=2024553 RepID=A0A2A6RHE3_9CHLR|nr:hypothetical protein [Candidatus Viridilinea mediisalina]PDW02316.1 hypothetical protein CJ255_14615 [Candidatus Viridilinea mediisalina]